MGSSVGSAIRLIRRLHQHRQWVNQKLLRVAENLDDEQMQAVFAIGQGSLWRTLTHLYAAEYIWLAALEGDEQPLAPGDVPEKLPGNQEGVGSAKSLRELQRRWDELGNRWNAYLAGLTNEELDDTVYKVSSLSGQRAGTRRSDILLHVCTHAQYTTAQAINMLRHLGARELPDPMLISLARAEERST